MAEPAGADVLQPVIHLRPLHTGFTEKLVVTAGQRPAFIEQYRKLAATLHNLQIARGLKIVMISSALPTEGKTLTAVNLALTLSESFQRLVLLVDGDLRHPSMHNIFQVANAGGLSHMLASESELTLPLVEISLFLRLLPAGAPDSNPMSRLTSDRMRRLLELAATAFEWVIIDTPPVGLLPDARLLAGMVDATLLVVRAGSTPYGLIQRAVAALGADRFVGVVLNGADDAAVGGGYSYEKYYEEYTRQRQQEQVRRWPRA